VNNTSASGVRAAGLAAASGLALIAAFQLLLALGVPLGRAAWGGKWGLSQRLDERGADRARASRSLAIRRVRRAVRPAAWLVMGVLGLGGLVNLASSSRWERFGWGPFALILAALCSIVARNPERSQDAFSRERE